MESDPLPPLLLLLEGGFIGSSEFLVRFGVPSGAGWVISLLLSADYIAV